MKQESYKYLKGVNAGMEANFFFFFKKSNGEEILAE